MVMDASLLSRIQFGMTVGFHFFFPPLSIGLAWLIAWLERRAWKRQDLEAASFARLFGVVFAILYIVGIATGLVMALQFGTNWAKFTTFVNAVFGPLLVAEVILAFFLESIFFGIWMFGGSRISARLRTWAITLVAIGATISAFWIVAADSWMQTPAGYVVDNGRAVLTDFWAAALNGSTLSRFAHVLSSAASITGVFIAAIAAWLAIKGRKPEFTKLVLTVGIVVSLLGIALSSATGVTEALRLGSQQKEKVAVFRGLVDDAGNLIVAAVPAEPAPVEAAATPASPEVPASPAASASGDAVPVLAAPEVEAVAAATADVETTAMPPVVPTKVTFGLMIVTGCMTALLYLIALAGRLQGFLLKSKGLLWALVWSIPLPIIATQAGWFAAEIGRQPWIVYGQLKTADALSPSVSGGEVLFSVILLGLVYLVLLVLSIAMTRNSVRKAFTADDTHAEVTK